MKKDVQIGQIILNWPRVLCSLWKSLLFFQEMHLNQNISNHTLEWEELQYKKVRYLHNIENSCFYYGQNHVCGNTDCYALWQASLRLWVMENPGLLPCWSLEGVLGRRNLVRGFWMGTRRQALPPVEWRPETARSSPLHRDSQQFVLSPLHVFFLLFLLYCVIWCHPCTSRGWTLKFQEPGCIGLGFNPSIY